jgi:hypothetical protein
MTLAPEQVPTGGLIMVCGGVVELAFGIKAEGQSLETVTKPLTAVSD